MRKPKNTKKDEDDEGKEKQINQHSYFKDFTNI